MRVGAVIGIGDTGVLHQSDAVADDPNGLSEREGVGEHTNAPHVDESVQKIITQSQVEELHEMTRLVKDTVFEEVF